jgi:hypothetical protein
MGELPLTLFWKIVDTMSLNLIGLTAEEISSMRGWVNWGHGDNVFYEGPVLSELAQIILSAIESQEKYDVSEALQVLEDKRKKPNPNPNSDSNQENTENAATHPEGVPPDLINYFQDTFHEYDIDKNGVLDVTEFSNFLVSLNLGLVGADLKDIHTAFTEWNIEHTGNIKWEEASIKFDEIVHKMASSERDHWICLFDKKEKRLGVRVRM